MATIIGDRDVSDTELAEMKERAATAFTNFWNSLAWQPIGEYDKAEAKSVLLREGQQWSFGHWGDVSGSPWAAGLPKGPAWRYTQETLLDTLIEFEPTEFAAVSPEWEFLLFCD